MLLKVEQILHWKMANNEIKQRAEQANQILFSYVDHNTTWTFNYLNIETAVARS